MKQKYIIALAAALPFAGVPLTAHAQVDKEKLEDQKKVHVLHVPESDSTIVKMETLSGIHLTPTKKGTFQLDFNQELKENARLEIKNKAGKLVYHAPISIADNKQNWKFNLGKLRSDTYSIEVKTSDTTYWTKFKIGR
jgi:hypothetical protein